MCPGTALGLLLVGTQGCKECYKAVTWEDVQPSRETNWATSILTRESEMHFVVTQMKGGILKAKLGKRTLARSPPHFETPHLSHRVWEVGRHMQCHPTRNNNEVTRPQISFLQHHIYNYGINKEWSTTSHYVSSPTPGANPGHRVHCSTRQQLKKGSPLQRRARPAPQTAAIAAARLQVPIPCSSA